MGRKARRIAGLMVVCFLLGCASRGFYSDSDPIAPIADAYSRNPVSAAPTLLGNLTCGFAAGVVILNTGVGISGEELLVRVPAGLCGFVIGTPFVPLSFLLPERPWRFRL